MRNRGPVGKGGSRRGLRYDGRAGEGREGGEGRIQRDVEKAAEDERALIHEQSLGLADW